MGTRSTTKILDEDGKHLVTLYRQFDGYPKGHGKELADFLNSKTLVNGYGDTTSTTEANGMGCLAALLIGHLKGGRIGNVYVTSKGDSQEYDYTVYLKSAQIFMRVESAYADTRLLYDGPASNFDGDRIGG